MKMSRDPRKLVRNQKIFIIDENCLGKKKFTKDIKNVVETLSKFSTIIILTDDRGRMSALIKEAFTKKKMVKVPKFVGEFEKDENGDVMKNKDGVPIPRRDDDGKPIRKRIMEEKELDVVEPNPEIVEISD
jgi:hypothetical protein